MARRGDRSLPESPSTGGIDVTVDAMRLGQRLRDLIDQKNLKHAAVAAGAGMTVGTLSSILTGKTAEPKFFSVLAIARAIGEPVSAIVDEPRHFWTNDEVDRLRDIGEWLVSRTEGEDAGSPLPLPKRRRRRTAPMAPVMATAGAIRERPTASELSRTRIPPRYARKGVDAIYRVHGDSMIGAGIGTGDRLYVRSTPDVRDAIGRIVVCAVEETLFVKKLTTEGRLLRLESAHAGHAPMLVDESVVRFAVLGIVVGWSRT